MTTLILGICWFLGVHSISILAPRGRDRAAARLGEGLWKGLYAVNSIAALVLLLRGYAEARLQPIYVYAPPASMHSVTALLMLPVFPLLLAAYLPGRIKRATRHPLLAATVRRMARCALACCSERSWPGRSSTSSRSGGGRRGPSPERRHRSRTIGSR